MKIKYIFVIILVISFSLISRAMDAPAGGNFAKEAEQLRNKVFAGQLQKAKTEQELPALIKYVTMQGYWPSVLRHSGAKIDQYEYSTSCIHNLFAIVPMCFSDPDQIRAIQAKFDLSIKSAKCNKYEVRTVFYQNTDHLSSCFSQLGTIGEAKLIEKLAAHSYNQSSIDALKESLKNDIKGLKRGESAVYFVAVSHWNGETNEESRFVHDHAFVLERNICKYELQTRIHQAWLGQSELCSKEIDLDDFMEGLQKLYSPGISQKTSKAVFGYVSNNDDIPRYQCEIEDNIISIFGFHLKFARTVVQHGSFVENFAKFMHQEGLAKQL